MFRLRLRMILFAIASACLTWSGLDWLDRRWHQTQAEKLFDGELAELDNQKGPSLPRVNQGPVARLEIPRIKVKGIVEVGFDNKTLDRAIGLNPSGPRPGEKGNISLAAHRDTFFSGLRHIRTGDFIDLQSLTGSNQRYRVEKTLIVDPKDSWVMQSTSERNRLTLITCYPFQYVGRAPQRFIVQATPVTERPLRASASRKH